MKEANSAFRCPSLRFVSMVVGASLFVAIVAALIAWPLRQEAIRTGTDAWIPFRVMTTEEASVLFKNSFNNRPLLRILAVDQKHVDVATSRYVLPSNVTSGEASDGLPSASWESFLTVHRLDRAAFERATGVDLATIVPDPLTEHDKVSFDSSKLAWYIACDIMILTIALSALALAFYVVRRKWWWLPVGTIWCIGFSAIVLWYSPAYFDADLFHQRLIVEVLAGFTFPIGLYSSPLSALMMAGGFIAWILDRFQRDVSYTAKLWTRRAALLSPFVALLGVIGAQGAWRHGNLKACLESVASTEGVVKLGEAIKQRSLRIEASTDGDLLKCKTTGCSELVASIEELAVAVEKPLRGTECGTGSTELTLFLPIREDIWLRAIISPYRNFSVIRNPSNGFSVPIGFDTASAVLADAPQINARDAFLWLFDIFSWQRASTASVAHPLVGAENRPVGALVAQVISW